MAQNTEPCYFCEEKVRVDRAHWRVHLKVDNSFAPESYDGEDSMGTFAVGPQCRKKVPESFRHPCLPDLE